MKVALVWLNVAGPPGVSHGLLVLARELREAGHAVALHHLNEVLGDLVDAPGLAVALAREPPELVGLSFASVDAAFARNLVRVLRAALPRVLIVCGGIHTTLNPEAVFAWSEVDAIGLGELDGGHFSALVECLERGERPTRVPGFWFRWGGQEQRNPLASLPDLEHQALPLYEGMDVDRLVRAKRGFGEVLSGRGCPFRCRFCQNLAVVERYRGSLGTPPSSWPYVRRRGLDGLMTELHDLKARAPSLRAIMFADDRLAADREWLTAFAGRYRSEIGLPFIVNATVDQIEPETVGLLRRAGCNMVKLGVECAPGEIRRRVLGRPEGEAEIRTAFSLLREAGINTMAYLMIGIPGETPDSVLASFRFCAELLPDAVRVAMFCPYPGTRLFEDLLRTGQLDPDVQTGGFGESSVLRWPPAMGALLQQAPRLVAWLLNQHLPQVGAASADFVDWARGHGEIHDAERESEGELERREAALWSGFRDRGWQHYLIPFPERPDYAFLIAPRVQPLINVDLRPAVPVGGDRDATKT